MPDQPRPSVLDPTRARPEPWFVGSGRGLMIAIISLVGMLLMARGVTTLWVAEDGWRWLRDGQPERIPRPIPPDVPPRAQGYLLDWFGPDDFPWTARMAGLESRVGIALLIDTTGRATACEIISTSGDRWVDSATCRAAMRHARYHPARDRAGRAVAARVLVPEILWSKDRRRSVGLTAGDWITNDDYPVESVRAEETGTSVIGWSVDQDGRVMSCDVRRSSGHERLDQAACGAILRNGTYDRIVSGGPQRYYSRRVVWQLPEET